VGGACGTHGGGEMFTGFWLGGPNVGDHFEHLGVGGTITLRWIRLAQDGVQWRTSENTLMDLRIP
jgi:hypothetical protein